MMQGLVDSQRSPMHERRVWGWGFWVLEFQGLGCLGFGVFGLRVQDARVWGFKL